jgi:hypothetical protein
MYLEKLIVIYSLKQLELVFDKGNILISEDTNYTQHLQQGNALKHYGCTQPKNRKRKLKKILKY